MDEMGQKMQRIYQLIIILIQKYTKMFVFSKTSSEPPLLLATSRSFDSSASPQRGSGAFFVQENESVEQRFYGNDVSLVEAAGGALKKGLLQQRQPRLGTRRRRHRGRSLGRRSDDGDGVRRPFYFIINASPKSHARWRRSLRVAPPRNEAFSRLEKETQNTRS